jgi:hypothetical protein
MENVPLSHKHSLVCSYTKNTKNIRLDFVNNYNAAARVQTRVGMWDFVMDKSGTGAGFLRELRFPLPI